MREIHARTAVLPVLMAVLLVLISSCVTKATLEDISPTAPNSFSCTYDGVKHDFIVDIPEKPEGSPLVIMLPGSGGTAESFRLDTQFHETACAAGYTVVYVTGAPDPKDSTSTVAWNYDGREDGNRDTGFLKALAAFIQEEYQTDSGRCYAAGFSNGAFMCHRLALEASDTFSAVIAVAGTMSADTWEHRHDGCTVSLLQIAGEKDSVIPRQKDGSSQYSPFPSIEKVIDHYTVTNGLGVVEVDKIGKESVLTKYTGAQNSNQVWFLLVKDGRHSWSAESVTGINTGRLILEFLESVNTEHDSGTTP